MRNSLKVIMVAEKALLAAAVGVLIVAGFLAWPRERPRLDEVVKAADAPAPQAGTDAEAEAAALEPFEQYADMLRSRDIFDENIPGLSGVPVAAVEVPLPSNSWRLAGVMLAGDPEAVVENQQTHELFFLRQGMPLEGMSVKAIERRRVVLTNNGQEVVISMEEK